MDVFDTAMADMIGDTDFTQAVTYTTAAGTATSITAVVDQCNRNYVDASGVNLISGARTFYILASALSGEPARGDTITLADGTVYDVHNQSLFSDSAYEVDCFEVRD